MQGRLRKPGKAVLLVAHQIWEAEMNFLEASAWRADGSGTCLCELHQAETREVMQVARGRAATASFPPASCHRSNTALDGRALVPSNGEEAKLVSLL